MTTQPRVDSELAQSLATISGLLISNEKLEAILELVAGLTARTLPNADGVSVTVVNGGRYTSAVYTDEVTRRVDTWQYTAEEGPCLSAVRDACSYLAGDLSKDERWTTFAKYAVEEGIQAILAVPLKPMGEPIGTLNVYSTKRGAFDENDLEVASVFAQQAAVVIANAIAYSSAADTNGHLKAALETRELIGQAKGILMVREKCSADEAFEILRAVSQRTNRKLREVAEEVVHSI